MSTPHRQALAGLLVLQALFFSPLLVYRQVIFPHANDLELTGTADPGDLSISNRKFSDESQAYIPEINQHLNGRPAGWLSTWNPYVQLGRPVVHIAGFGKAYPFAHLIGRLTKNPFVAYTGLVVLTVCLTGVFCFLFLESLGLHPVACFSSAGGLSLGVFVTYWLTFVMFVSTVCWTVALLWLVTRAVERRSLGWMIAISFAVYSLLLSGYPQYAIMQMYLVAGFTMLRLGHAHTSLRASFRTASLLAGGVVLGVAMALPAYLDLAISAQRSSRLAVSDDFFLAVLPRIERIRDGVPFLGQLVDPFWFGNPMQAEYPFSFNGITLTPLYFILVLASFTRGQWRRLWPWQLFAAGCLLATVCPPVFRLMIHYLGFNLSRSLPLGGALIPAFVLAAYSLDDRLRSPRRWPIGWLPLVLGPLLLVALRAWLQDAPLHHGFVGLTLAIACGTGLLMASGRPALAAVLCVVTVLAYGPPLVLRRPLSAIHLSSPLVERIRRETTDGSRYAKVGPEVHGLLPSNQEALLQIPSIGSYDSLASTAYQRVALTLNAGGTVTYGRQFHGLDRPSRIGDDAFSYTGVGVLLSRQPLDDRLCAAVATFDGVTVYRTRRPPILSAQLTDFRTMAGGASAALDGPLHAHSRLEAGEVARTDDRRRFRLTPAARETLLFLSEQHHPRWTASAAGRPLVTVVINQFYLGVMVPAGVSEVEVSFRPFVTWSWIPQALYATLALALCARRMGPSWSLGGSPPR